jgi:hypothetical protein
MKRAHYAMLVSALLWLGAVVRLIVSNSIAREIRPIGAIAHVLDKLPEVARDPTFVVGWFVFLLGWMVLLIFGARPPFTRRSKISN